MTARRWAWLLALPLAAQEAQTPRDAPKEFTRRELQVVGANAYLCGQLDELATVASLDTTRDTWMAGAAKRANCDKIHELIDGVKGGNKQ